MRSRTFQVRYRVGNHYPLKEVHAVDLQSAIRKARVNVVEVWEVLPSGNTLHDNGTRLYSPSGEYLGVYLVVNTSESITR